MTRESTAKLKEEAGVKLERVNEDVEAIEDRVYDAKERFQQSRSNRALTYIYSQVKRDPIGYLMVGTGLFRLFRHRGEKVETRERLRERTGEYREMGKEKLFNRPLIFAGLGLIAGSIIAAILPETRREKETVGPFVDKIRDRVTEQASEQVHKVTESMK